MLSLTIIPHLRSTVVPSSDLQAPALQTDTLGDVDKRPPHPTFCKVQPANHHTTLRTKKRPLLFAAVSVICMVYLAGLVHYAQVRPIDGDEGYYTTAARLVWEGETPYRDFSYPQGPLLPYIYSWIWAIHPRSLIAMRFLSAACGGIAVLMWGWGLLSVKRLPTNIALTTFAIVLLNPYWVSWNTVVKTFAVANLLMSIVMICFYVALRSGQSKWYFIAGFALGACASVRLLYAPLVPFVLVWMLHKEWQASKSLFPNSLSFLGGATCGLSPMMFSFIGDPHAFIFNNLRYHPLLASHVSFRHTIHLYSTIALSLLHAKYFVAEMVLAVAGGLAFLKLHKRVESPYTYEDRQYLQLAFLMLLAYVGAALIPFPPFDQYFDGPLVPFVIPFVAEGLRTAFRSGAKWAVVFVVIAPILFLNEVNRDTAQCSSAPALRLSSYQKVTRVIEANTNADDVVLSFWPGYIFESGRQYFPGSENKFNYSITPKMSSEERSKYHVVSRGGIMNALSTRAVSLFITYPRVLDNHDDNMSSRELQAFHAVVDGNYSLLATVDDIEVYRRRTSVPQQNLSSRR